MVVFGESERPRVVACGFDRTHRFAAATERYAGMVHYLNEDPDIRWQSWDAVVSLGWCDVPDNHLRVLQVGGDPIGRTGNLGSYETALVRMEHVGDELEIPDGSPADLRDLVKRELLPLVNPR